MLPGNFFLLQKKNCKKKSLWPLFMDGVQLPQGYSHFEEAVYFLPTSEGWKAESTLEPPSGFEHGTPKTEMAKNYGRAILECTHKSITKFLASERLAASLFNCLATL